MKYIIRTLLLLFIGTNVYSQSNLSSFEVIDEKGLKYIGYAEPRNEMTSTTVKSRIFIFPKVNINKNSLVVRNQKGDIVNISNYSQFSNLTARINLELQSNIPDEDALLQIIAEINPGIIKPKSVQEKPIEPVSGSDYEEEMRRASIYFAQLSKWENSRNEAIEYLRGYQVVPVFPKSLEFKIIVNGVTIKNHILSQNSSVSPGSTFQINIPFSDQLFHFRLLLEQDYIVQSNFKYLSSKFQSASAIKDVNSFVDYAAEQFRKDIVRASSSSSGFLIWKSSRRSIQRYVEEQSHQNLSSGTVSKYEYKLYDVDDETLKKQVDNFLFPESSLNETVNNHLEAAKNALNNGNKDMAQIHTDYANFLQNNATSLADVNHINVLGALTSLGKGNIASFLAQGFAFNNTGSSGNFTFRRIISGNLSHNDTKTFNALIFKSLIESHIITSKPQEIKLTKTIPLELENAFVLIEGGSLNVGEDVPHPSLPSGAWGYEFSSGTHTNKTIISLNDYWIGKFEVSQTDWINIMNSNASHFKGANLPVTNVSWLDALEYCNRLSKKYNLKPYYSIIDSQVRTITGADGFRLPTREQWEFAAKGGLKSEKYYYSGSQDADLVAWYNKNSLDQLHSIGRKNPNEVGLYDMSGNVSEWNFESKSDFPLKSNELHTANSENRKLVRGGSFKTDDSWLDTWSCHFYPFNYKSSDVGFRIVLPSTN
ncbi:MAG: SUMF1/EgtB/PvdO family nonheme iron enzyme [Bacteroidales bacterium]|nr:SUMF1/EgtB/PvdO family nonheme iron enzyme [Bacteroidales bacterium]